MRRLTLCIFTTLALLPASRVVADETSSFLVPTSSNNVWHVEWTTPSDGTPSAPAPRLFGVPPSLAQDSQGLHTAAVEHSEAYQTRAKIHKYASFATLPLFATELALGQSLYDGSGGDSKKGWHAAIGASIISLFAVNSVTGVWNMFGAEGRQEKQGRKLRLVHGLLMLAADAGFVATFATTPDGEGEHGGASFEDSKSTHRTIAITSIGLGTAGYLAMLFGNHH